MRKNRKRKGCLIATTALACAANSALAYEIGLSELRAVAPTLLGDGVIVAQPEVTTVDSGTNFDHDNFEIDPIAAGISVPITYIKSTGDQVSFDANFTSSHATTVAYLLANSYNGVAPNLVGILNYNANYYINTILQNVAIPQSPQVINQSFILTPLAPYTADVLNQAWDSFVATQGVIVVTGAGNGGDVQVPATAYNVIAVGAYGGASSSSQAGQTAKPDITAPGMYTSFSAPLVSGAAALLVQAATTSNYGVGADPRVIKAILLNGAVKPGDWIHDNSVPLDRRYGAGILNVFNSYENLIAGEFTRTNFTRTGSLGGSHPPSSATTGFVGAVGWNLGTLSSTNVRDGVDHYVIDLTQNPSGVPLILTATLTWQRAQDDALTTEIQNSNASTSSFTSAINTINNLDLFLYDANTQMLVDQSVSSIDNVEHLYTLSLMPDKYDLQVLKNGGNVGTANVFSNYETYGLAWSIASITEVKSVTNNTLLTFGQSTAIPVSATIFGSGSLTQSGTGTTMLAGAANYSGATSIAAGKLVFTGAVSHTVGAVSLSGGNLTVEAGATLVSQGVTSLSGGTWTINGTHRLASGSTAIATSKINAAPIIGVAGQLDLTNQKLIVQSDGTNKATLLADLKAQVLAGKAGGTWTGFGITSSTIVSDIAGGNTATTIALADNGAYGTPKTSFGGQAVDSNSLLVTRALIGDVDLNNSVTTADLNALIVSYGKTGVTWASGDVTSDGNVTTADLNALIVNYGKALAGGFSDLPMNSGTGLTAAVPASGGLTGAAVPEPASLAVLALGAVGVLGRKRRSDLRRRRY
jgi:autotransporter-associated beta strand protein